MEHIPTPIAGKDLSGYDYVLVETRTTKGKVPHQWEQTGKVCDFDWFKQCIVSSPEIQCGLRLTTRLRVEPCLQRFWVLHEISEI